VEAAINTSQIAETLGLRKRNGDLFYGKPRLESEAGGFHLLVKLLAGGCAAVLAAEIAKPPKPKLNL
jgi:hypothetical protein